MESSGLFLKMINRIVYESVDFLELARKAVNQLFFLFAHLVGGQMPHILDFLSLLGSQFSEEFIRLIDLILKVLFGTSHCVENL